MTSTVTDLMSEQPGHDPAAGDTTPSPAVELVLPVYNEHAILDSSVRRLHGYLLSSFPFSFRITIADNASTDATWEIAQGLAAELPEVTAVHLDQKGRGRALREVWSHSNATVVAYMDIDLSTDLAALLPLVAPLLSGHSDVAIGSRLNKSSRVVRGAKREVISRSYNLLLRTTLAGPVQRRAVRLQGHPHRRGPATVAVGREHRLVLRHRAARAGRTLRAAHPRGAGRLGGRSGQPGRHPRRRCSRTCSGVPRMCRALATGRLPIAALRRQLGRDPAPASVAGVPVGMTRQAVRFAAIGVGSTIAYLMLYRSPAR